MLKLLIEQAKSKLLKNIVEIFSQQKEIYNISVFGREVGGKADRYSDIDIIICTDDLAKTQKYYKQKLSTISPILGNYFLRLEDTEIVEMILLKGISPYNKIDLSISNNLAGKSEFSPFKKLYCREGKGPSCSTKIRTNVKYSKNINMLHDRLFSIPRFTKTLFRDEQQETYRRWQATINEYLKILMRKYLSYVPEKQLHPIAFKNLKDKINRNDSNKMKMILPAANNFSIGNSYKLAMHEITKYYLAKISTYPYREFYNTMMQFLNEEIDRFYNGKSGKNVY